MLGRIEKRARRLLRRDVLAVTAAHYDVSIPALRSESRSTWLVRPRQVACFIMSRNGNTLPTIGTLLCRDHTTVLHAVLKIDRLAADDAELRATIETICGKIETRLRETPLLGVTPVARHSPIFITSDRPIAEQPVSVGEALRIAALRRMGWSMRGLCREFRREAVEIQKVIGPLIAA